MLKYLFKITQMIWTVRSKVLPLVKDYSPHHVLQLLVEKKDVVKLYGNEVYIIEIDKYRFQCYTAVSNMLLINTGFIYNEN